MSRNRLVCVAAGVAGGSLARSLLPRLVLLKLRRDLRSMNAGDYGPILSAFARDAVLVFNDGEHRWAGEHRGRPAIERFLSNFVAAGMQGEIREVFVSGPPWRMTMLARFDDWCDAPDGTRLYSTRTVPLVRARWGRIVRQEDYYEDTARIDALEAALRERGRMPVTSSIG